MSTINFNFFRFSWKFIFIGQFFILICNFRIIFIVVYCVVFYNKTLRWMALRRSHFQCGKCEGRRSQSSVARTPSLALPPRWARKEFCVVVYATLLTFVYMLRYSEWNAVPTWFLYSSIFMVVRCADPVSVFFDTYRNILYQSDISGQDAQSASIPLTKPQTYPRLPPMLRTDVKKNLSHRHETPTFSFPGLPKKNKMYYTY